MPQPGIDERAAAPAAHQRPGAAGLRAELLFVRMPMHVLAVVMLAGVGLNFANVIARYFFKAPIFWAEEVLVYAMIWAVFLALPAVTFNNEQLRMDLFYVQVGRRWRRAVDALCALLYITCGAFAAYHSCRVVALLWANRQSSVTAELPMAAVHAALPIGFALMVLATAARMLARPADASQEGDGS